MDYHFNKITKMKKKTPHAKISIRAFPQLPIPRCNFIWDNFLSISKCCCAFSYHKGK
jgi:hypothetical protein